MIRDFAFFAGMALFVTGVLVMLGAYALYDERRCRQEMADLRRAERTRAALGRAVGGGR